MRKNTGRCGGNKHDHCPPMMGVDKAKTHADFCDFGTVENPLDIERTVILGDVPVRSSVEADVHLPSYASDIKHIRKNVHLTQCEAVPVKLPGLNVTNQLDLYLEGYVHKNIQYSEGHGSYVKDYSVNVPFKCYNRVTLPSGASGQRNTVNIATSQKSNQIQEIRVTDDKDMGADRCEFGSITFENLNEPVECRLLRAKVSQMDFSKNFNTWGQFNKVTEKLTIDFVVRLTQIQRREDAGMNPGETYFEE